MNKNLYGFLDFGCSNGGSIEFAERAFGGVNGIGIDIDPVKVKSAQESGFNAIVCDATKIDPSFGRFKFSIMSHFLEHLPSFTAAKICINSAILVSEDFLFIQQPYFDADGILLRDGYKLFWSDWSGHPNRMTSLEFHNILNPLKDKKVIKDYRMYGYKRIESSLDTAILPLKEGINQLSYDGNVHRKKKPKKFSYPIFHEIKVFVSIGDDIDFRFYEEKFGWSERLLNAN